jgi:hypothetical protein
MKFDLLKKNGNLSSAFGGFIFGCGAYLVLAWATPGILEGPTRMIQAALHSIRPPAIQLQAMRDSTAPGQSCTYGKNERFEIEVLVGIESSKPSSNPSWTQKAQSKTSRSIASSEGNQEGRRSPSALKLDARKTGSASNRAF